MSIEAMKQALEALENSQRFVEASANAKMLHGWGEQLDTAEDAITSLRQAIREHALHEVQRLGQEIEQEPMAWSGGYPELRPRKHHEVNPPQLEQNFCPRCGKRTNDIHTCTPPQRTEPPDWFPAVENILNEYGLQAIDFVADFKAAMKDAEKSQRTWVGLTDEEVKHEWEVWRANVPRYAGFAKGIEAKLKERNG